MREAARAADRLHERFELFEMARTARQADFVSLGREGSGDGCAQSVAGADDEAGAPWSIPAAQIAPPLPGSDRPASGPNCQQTRPAQFASRRFLRENRAASGLSEGGEDRRFMKASRLLANLPNLITLARLVMTPLAVSMILSQRFVEAFVIFVLAGVSDGVDGFLAKRFDLAPSSAPISIRSPTRRCSIRSTSRWRRSGQLAAALAILVVSRDLMILFAVLVSWLLGNPVAIRPVFISKLNTVAQIAFAAFLLGSRAFGFHEPFVQDALGWIVAASTLASGGVYIAQWLDHMSL